jgi:hypothetical protein
MDPRAGRRRDHGRARGGECGLERRRDGTRASTGYDLAVYRIADGELAEAWFFPDGFDPEALTAVFSPAQTG